MATFIVRKDSQGDYYWILRSDQNFKTVVKSSESYDSKQGAMQSIVWTKANASSAGIVDDA